MTVEILKTYLKRLTNLSQRNRSLLLPSLAVEQTLDIHELDFLTNKSSFDIVQQLIGPKAQIHLCDVLDSRLEKVNQISKQLRKIARHEAFITAERGAQDLYVGYPFVRGKLIDGTVIHAPLVFFAVTLMQDGNRWMLQKRNESITLNRSFLLAYSHYNQVIVPNDLIEQNLQELDKDALIFRTQLYELLKNSPLEINFNQDIFQNQLQPFDSLNKADLELLEHNGELKLYSEAVLGIFPQTGSYLSPDYEALIGNVGIDDAAIWRNSQLQTPNDSIQLPKEENTFTVFAQDASQEEALQRIKTGESLVVQGPPGTGKSQLIANLMADFAARGKTVLLVCQKRVAIDVVHQRLKDVGLQPFMALVHDFKNDRADLYQQLNKQIEDVESYKKQNYGLDAVLLERQFLQTCRSIDQAVATLDEFKKVLFDETICGLSAKELYLTSNPAATQITLGNDFKNFRLEGNNVFCQKLQFFGQYHHLIAPTHDWYERVNFAKFGFDELQHIQTLIQSIPSISATLAQKIATITGQIPHWTNLLEWHNHRTEADKLLQLITDKNAFSFFQTLITNPKFKKNLPKSVSNSSDPCVVWKQGIIEDEVKTSDLATFEKRLQNIIEARNSTLKWLFYGDKTYFKTLCSHYQLELDPFGLQKLAERLENRKKYESLIATIEQKWDKPIATELPTETQTAYTTLAEALKQAEQGKQIFDKLTMVIGVISDSDSASFEFATQTINQIAEEAHKNHQQWRQYLTQSQIEQLINGSAMNMSQSLAVDFESLVEADALYDSCTEVEQKIIAQLKQRLSDQRLSDQRADTFESIFQNSLKLSWLRHIEELNPILKAVSSLKMSQLEENLILNIEQKQKLSREILLIKTREQTYENVEFNRLKNRTTYRELQHQVTKKRKIWPIRQLLDHHADEVFKLIPCWMTSPEAASAIFPLTAGLFDLVIFDEASQCYAEYGVPALHRAKQIVVAGDSQQLQPNDIYRIKFDNQEQDDSPELEAESLLDLMTQQLPQTRLEGHYRSQSLDLISFSNQYFYQNKLQLLPHFEAINRNKPAIQYIKVEGEWKNNTNQIEAERVVALIKTIQESEPQLSIGVVTFNYHQQRLIQDLLDSSFDHKTLIINDKITNSNKIFIKNIENVQGDECDVIIFSIAYAADLRGVVKAQFGHLNREGGQNRLNVAVTRARLRVYVITSIWPQQLQVEDSLHSGPKLLKAYLQYAKEVSDGFFMPKTPIQEKYRQTWMLKAQPIAHLRTNWSVNFISHLSSLKTELPFADLTIKNGNQYEGVIITDDDLYYQSRSVKEAHAYLPMHLKQKKWPFERLWSREWWRKQSE